ncbi:deaminase [Nocardia wallacei]|uniref:deaminase n=1 Tax=Nocardia wallacei TaxID=480035 RepID=UPI002453B9AD|nr:deaminase [Nocardia wallacei]
MPKPTWSGGGPAPPAPPAEGGLLRHAQNRDVPGRFATGNPQPTLGRAAPAAHDPDFLRDCTLYTSTEPCAMCSGAIYWSGIGRVVYALGEDQLLALTGADPENPTMALPCRQVFAAGQRLLPVVGPIELPEARAVHDGFWNRG